MKANKANKMYVICKWVVTVIALFAGLVTLFQFISNKWSLPQLLESIMDPGSIDNALSEPDGIMWDAVFYPNKELQGPESLHGSIRGARNGLHVDWGNGSPGHGVPIDFFSAIFSTTYHFSTGLYCFVLEVDDGARLFVDGVEIRSVWWGYTPGAVYKTPLALEEAPHKIVLYYYEDFEHSGFHLYWYQNPGSECVTIGHPGVP
jgi:hypothetical protein